MHKVLISLFLLFITFNVANADIYYQDNDTPEFKKEYDGYNYDTLIAKGANRTPRQEYFLAFAYLINRNDVFSSVDYCKAFEGFKEASRHDVVDAYYNISVMYYNGQCVERNLDEASKYLISAGEDGYVKAQSLIGRAYWGVNAGDLFNKDNTKAREWLEKAAENGDAPSAASLAYLYEHGVGGEKNPELAFKWRLKSASLPYGDFALAYFEPLGRYYEKGYGTNIDLVQAYKYYDLSGSVGSGGRARISKQMTSEQIAEAKRQSRQWQEDHHHYNPGYNGLQRQADGSYR